MLRDVNEKIVMIWLSLLGSPNYRIYRALLSEYGISCSYVTGQDGYGIYRLDYQE
jgi:hypothetical protein